MHLYMWPCQSILTYLESAYTLVNTWMKQHEIAWDHGLLGHPEFPDLHTPRRREEEETILNLFSPSSKAIVSSYR